MFERCHRQKKRTRSLSTKPAFRNGPIRRSWPAGPNGVAQHWEHGGHPLNRKIENRSHQLEGSGTAFGFGQLQTCSCRVDCLEWPESNLSETMEYQSRSGRCGADSLAPNATTIDHWRVAVSCHPRSASAATSGDSISCWLQLKPVQGIKRRRLPLRIRFHLRCRFPDDSRSLTSQVFLRLWIKRRKYNHVLVTLHRRKKRSKVQSLASKEPP